jgi:hypothetical protein
MIDELTWAELSAIANPFFSLLNTALLIAHATLAARRQERTREAVAAVSDQVAAHDDRVVLEVAPGAESVRSRMSPP